MNIFDKMSIKAKNLKCFGEKPQGLDCIKPVNLIIGRNNSGKTTLLDMLKLAIRPGGTDPDFRHRGLVPEIIITFNDERMLSKHIQINLDAHHNILKFNNMLSQIEYKHYINERAIQFSVQEKNDSRLMIIDDQTPQDMHQAIGNMRNVYLGFIVEWLRSFSVIRVTADRDIQPEKDPTPFE
jgi:predicted ATP-dependent endonuclease of OLD family